MSGDEPLRGSGERIISRARLPMAAVLALPLVVIAIEYFFFLLEKDIAPVDVLHEVKQVVALFAALAVLPPIILAFCRELQVHTLIDKLLGVREAVDALICDLLRDLAAKSGYAHPERIVQAPVKAREWFYSYANTQAVLRSYAFELWEGYYVGLYLSLASAISSVILFGLALLFQDRIAWSFFGLCAILFFAEWGVRHWSTVPKIMRLPAQQVGEILAGNEVLDEARRRFG